MMSGKSNNMPFNTSASCRMTLVTIKILMIILLGLSLSVMSTPLIWEPEWSAIVVPITQSLITAQQGRLLRQSKNVQWWNDMYTPMTHSKSAGTVTEAPYLYSTCHGFSCRNMNRGNNRNVEDHRDKNRHGQNHQETKRCGHKQNEKERCGGKNQHQKHCGKNQHQKHCGKNKCKKRCGKNLQCKERCGKNQGKKHCGEKRNGQSRHDTTNCNRQNKWQNNMKNGNKHPPFVVDNKVFINVNDGRTPGPTPLPRIETTAAAAAAQSSIVPQSVGHRSCSSFYSSWHADVMWLSLSAICIAIIFCIYKVYFISDRYHSIIY